MYELVIGLEIHVKIDADTKLFCSCKNEQEFDTLVPNTHVCPVCTAQPGALPVLQMGPYRQALLFGKALGCDISSYAHFDRKSYFYPDLPSGYQITQFYNPSCVNGSVHFFVDKDYTIHRTVSIRDAHIETDTGKTIHVGDEAMLDFNRAGTPLVEVVTSPDFRDADEVVAFLKELQRIARYNNISDADLEKGQMRVDVNISIRKPGQQEFGTRVEIKNMNSYSAIKRAIDNEYIRQSNLLDAGSAIDQETRGRDDSTGQSFSMRSKENTLDYRYFPDPDLGDLYIDQSDIKDLSILLPFDRIRTLAHDFQFNKEYINALLVDMRLYDYFVEVYTQGFDPKLVAKRLVGQVSARLKQNNGSIDTLPFDQKAFVSFLTKISKKDIEDNQAKIVLDLMLSGQQDVDKIIQQKGFTNVGLSQNIIDAIIDTIINQHADVVQQYLDGKTTTMGFFVGQVMKQTKGQARPQEIQDRIEKKLSAINR